MTNPAVEARRRERDGDLREAAISFTRAGFDKLGRSRFEPNRTFRVGIATLVRALSCDARSETDRCAVGLRRTIEGPIEHVRSETTDDCLVGLCHEWRGDSRLLTRPSGSVAHYSAALDQYRSVSEGAQLSWGMEEEFEYAYWAVEAYLSSRGFDDVEQLPELDFERRVETKLDLVEAGSLL